MTSKTNVAMKKPEGKHVKEMGPNWVVIVGGALLCTLSIRLCSRLKQIFDFKSSRNTHTPSKENGHSTHYKRHESQKLPSQSYCIVPDEDGYHMYSSGAKHTPRSPLSKDGENSLPLVKVSSAQSYIDNGLMWASSDDRLELPPKPFNHANSSDSPCISESGSDIYSKRDVIQKLRQQLKRRDDMIMEMQAQITVLQNSLTLQTNRAARLQTQLDSSNQDLLDSEREIKWLQRTIPEAANGHADSSVDVDLHWIGNRKVGGEDRVEMLKREVEHLKEVIQGKEFLIQSYREQKIRLCSKVNELQLRLVSQASQPDIL